MLLLNLFKNIILFQASSFLTFPERNPALILRGFSIFGSTSISRKRIFTFRLIYLKILFYSRHPRSLPFRKPVDPVALGIFPAYNQIITHPIDLGTIKTQIGKIHSFWTKNWTFRELYVGFININFLYLSLLDNGLYNTKDELIADIQLVWNNAKKFNPMGHAVWENADFLEKIAHERIGKLL